MEIHGKSGLQVTYEYGQISLDASAEAYFNDYIRKEELKPFIIDADLDLKIRESEQAEKVILDRIRLLLHEWIDLSKNTVKLKTARDYRERYWKG